MQSSKKQYAEAETVQAVKEGIESFERGEGRPAKEALGDPAKKYDLPR